MALIWLYPFQFSFLLSGPRARPGIGYHLQPAFGTTLKLRIVARGIGAIVRILTFADRGAAPRSAAVHITLDISARSRIPIDRLIRIVGRIAGVVRVARVVRIAAIVPVVRIAPARPPIDPWEAEAYAEPRSAMKTTVTSAVPAAAIVSTAAVGKLYRPTVSDALTLQSSMRSN